MLLKAGFLELLYENGFIRYLRAGEDELVRMIYYAVRDQDWNTIPATLEDELISKNENSFSIQYKATVKQSPVHFVWWVNIKGFENGSIEFTISGEAKSDFLKNRIGFCVLHPTANIAEQCCTIIHPDGASSQLIFPDRISPHQPFHRICEMHWELKEKVSMRLQFGGDVFETEDQRNWSDASYKTYCTPLSLPFPVQMKVGMTVQQSVRFETDLLTTESVADSKDVVEINISNEVLPFPAIGLGIQSEGMLPDDNEIIFLRQAGFNHLRADIFFPESNWRQKLAEALFQSEKLQLSLQLATFWDINYPENLSSFFDIIHGRENLIDSIFLYEEKTLRTTDGLINAVAPSLREKLPHIKIGGGTDTNFAEFNRNAFCYDAVDFIGFSVNPQVHAFDDLSLIENISAQRDVVMSARRIAKNKPVHVTPVTLKPRFNPSAISSEINVVPPADHRQATAFTAAWALGSLKNLAEGGVSSITYFETSGPRGIVSGDKVFPVGSLLSKILAAKPTDLIVTTSSAPLKISSFLIRNDTQTILFIANHTPATTSVLLPGGVREFSSPISIAASQIMVVIGDAETMLGHSL